MVSERAGHPCRSTGEARFGLAVPARHGCDLVLQLVRHENAQLRPAAPPPRASQRLTFGWDILAVALFSLVIYAFAILSRLPAEQALDYIGDPTVEEPEGIDARVRRPRLS
jgi:hypothetical protein